MYTKKRKTKRNKNHDRPTQFISELDSCDHRILGYLVAENGVKMFSVCISFKLSIPYYWANGPQGPNLNCAITQEPSTTVTVANWLN